MKLSSRQKLLKEADITLNRLRESINEAADGNNIYLFYASARDSQQYKNTSFPDFVVMAANPDEAFEQIKSKKHYGNRYGGWDIYSLEKSKINQFLNLIKQEADFWNNGMQSLMGIKSLSPGNVISIENIYQPMQFKPMSVLTRED